MKRLLAFLCAAVLLTGTGTAAAACFLLFVSGIGGYAAYFTPVAAVYADGSGYAQLTVNRFSRVIAVAGDMGENTLKNMDCEQAQSCSMRQLRRMLPEADFPNTQMQEEACTGQGEKHTWAHGKNQKNQSEQPMA